jgi:hypothetical protein
MTQKVRLEPASAGAVDDADARRAKMARFAERARRSREALRGRTHSDSAHLIREDRNRDYDNAWS